MYFLVAASKVYVKCEKDIFEGVLETLKYYNFTYYTLEFDGKLVYYYFNPTVTFIGYKEV